MDNFCLKWNDFGGNIRESLKKLRSDEALADVTLATSYEYIIHYFVTKSSATPSILSPLTGTFKYHDRSNIEGEYLAGGFPALALTDLLNGTCD